MIGLNLQNYQFEEVLGSGTFGEVFRCVKGEREFAIKVVREGPTSDIEVSIGNNVNLSSPFLVKYYEIIRHPAWGGKVFIVMDLCSEGDVRKLLKSLNKSKGIVLSFHRLIKIFIQLLLGLYALHANKVLHCDLKPDNVFIDRSDNVKIGDFGCGKILASSVAGSPAYFSPEIVEEKPYDNKSDVWSLGVMMYELCCLEPPFKGSSFLKLCMNILNGIFEPIPKDSCSDDLRVAIHSMLQKNPDLRPSIPDLLCLDFVQAFARELNLLQYFPSGIRIPSSSQQPLESAGNPVPKSPAFEKSSSFYRISSMLHREPAAAPTKMRSLSAPKQIESLSSIAMQTVIQRSEHPSFFNIGNALPNYNIVKEIAHNIVFLVERKDDKTTFAIKVISHEEGMSLQAELKIPLVEITRYPYLVRCFGISELIMDRSCIFMEFCSGGSLAARIAQRKKTRNPFSEDEICKVVVQIGHALDYLHRKKKIAHRDVKPGNILLSEEKVYKLGDFGLSSAIASISQKRSVVGTNGYTAPEVYINGDKGYNETADVFSFGMVLYEMIMLQNPFWEEDDHGRRVNFSVERARVGNVPPLNAGHLSADLLTLVSGFLVVDVRNRLTICQALEEKIITDFVRRTPEVLVKE